METFGNRMAELLNRCAAVCDHCAAACLKEKEVELLAACIEADMACAAVCRTTALLLELGIGEQNALLLCAEVCKHCADECNKHEHDHCRACTEICNECAVECGQSAVA
ncbi:four-helix bundle copper-binding protein [Niabella aurantiaca]|uniref:four-helix bundle copper-binding protein n=1 Tax=Niabella aurantiaca TaxID=379900 RepID=UPI0008FC1813|nr:four-helix bundle copper-binding protein [Niabella aurantiaca]